MSVIWRSPCSQRCITPVTLTLGPRRESQPSKATVEELPAPLPAEMRKERQWTSV
jgi:hypothetical protein